MAGSGAGQARHGLDVVVPFVDSLVGADPVRHPGVLGVLLADELARIVAGTAIVVLDGDGHGDGDRRVVASGPAAGLVAGYDTGGDAPVSVAALVDLAEGGAAGSTGEDVREVLAAIGIPWVHALAMVVGGRRVGTAICLGAAPPAPADQATAMAIVGIAAVVRAVDTARRAEQVRADQLQYALTSRIVVEQAKGMLAEQGQVTPDEAFNVLRAHCRRTNQRVQAVAGDVVARRIGWTALSPR